MSTYFKLGSLFEGLTTTATSGGTTALTVSSRPIQVFTGTSNETVTLPNATTLNVGRRFDINNRSTGIITVQDNASGTITTIPAGSQRFFIVTDIGSAAGVWRIGGVSGSSSASLTSSDKISILSGLAGLNYSDSNIESRMISVNPEEVGGNYWLTESSLPIAKQSSVAFPLNGYIYNSVGLAGAVSATTYRYSDDSNYWLSRANANTAREEMPGHFVLNGAGYFGGGNNGANLATVEKYNDTLNSWSLVASLGTARIRTPGAALGGYGFMFSGVTSPSTVVVNTHEIYDDVANTWTTRSGGMTVAKGGAGRFELEDTVYISGGYLNGGSVAASQTTAESFNYSLNTFRSEAALSAARSYIAGASASGVGVLAGGTNGSNMTSVDVYYPSAKAFIAAASLASAKATMPGAGLNGAFYYTGGNGGPVATVEAYIPFAMFSLGSLKRSTATPTSILAAVKSVGLTGNVPVQIRSDGNNWKTFLSNSSSILKQGETLATKFQYTPELYWSGGTGGSSTNNDRFDDNANAWTARQALLTAALSGSSFAIDGYSFRLSDDGAQLNNQRYDSVLNTQTARAVILNDNEFGSDGTAWTLGGIGYYACGESDDTTNDSLQSYSNTTNTWTQKTNTTNPHRRAVGFGLFNSFGFCGNNISGLTTNIERYDPVSNAWTSVTNITNRRDNAHGANLEGKGYVIGGSSTGASANAQDSIYEYDHNSNAWTTKVSTGYNLMFLGAQYSADQIFWAGGTDSGGGTLGSTRRFNPFANTVTTRTAMTTASSDVRNHPPGPYRNYEIRVGIPAFYAGLGSFQWVTRANMNVARGGGYGGITGGQEISTGNGTQESELYNREANSWSLGTPPSSVGANCSAAFTLGDILYATAHTSGNERYNPVSKAWTSYTANVAPRIAGVQTGANSLNGFGWLATGGNVGGTIVYPAIEKYDPSTNAWSSLASRTNTNTNYAGGFVSNGFITALPGMDASRSNGSTGVDRYNDAANTWSVRTVYPIGNFAFGHGLTFNGIPYSVGGFSGAATATVYRYMFDSDTWLQTNSYPVAIYRVSGGSTGLIFGGNTGAPTSITYQLTDSMKQAVLGFALEVK